MNKKELLNGIIDTFTVINKSKAFHEIQESVKGEKVLLACLFQNGGECSPGKLADSLNVSAARVAAILKSLESRNYIERILDGADKRRVLVKLTEKGDKFVEELKELVLSHALTIFDRLGENDSLEFIRIVKKILETEETIDEQRSDCSESED